MGCNWNIVVTHPADEYQDFKTLYVNMYWSNHLSVIGGGAHKLHITFDEDALTSLLCRTSYSCVMFTLMSLMT